MENKNEIVAYQEEINSQVAIPAVMNSLVAITFKGLTPDLIKRALLEGMMTGFTFKDFLKKNVYAIPFKDGYSLISSIDYARELGMLGNVVGVGEPMFEEDENGKLISCKITVKKKSGEYIGEYTSKVYFDEYYKIPYKNKQGYEVKSLWDSKPRTMLGKVAEMHALRKACPEKLSKIYIEEEYEKDAQVVIIENETKEEKKDEKVKTWSEKMKECETEEQLMKVWADIPGNLKQEPKAKELLEELKLKFIQ